MIPSKHGPSEVKKKKTGVQVMRARSKSRFVQKPQGRSGPVTRISQHDPVTGESDLDAAERTMTVTYETDANGNPTRIVE